MSVTLYLSNVSEDVWDLIQTLPKKERAFEVAENTSLSDRELWANVEEKSLIMVMLAPLSETFVNYYKSLAPHQQLEVIIPQDKTGQTCADLLDDKKAWAKLLTLCQSEEVKLISYSATPQFWQVAEALRAAGISLTTPESPLPQASWTPNFFGSKSGIRQLVVELQGPQEQWMSHGYSYFGIKDIASAAADRYSQHNGVVIKINKAHAGVGVLLFKPGDLPTDYTACYQELLTVLSNEPYWSQFPVIVEELVNIDMGIGGGNPNVEYKVTAEGKVEFLFPCGMRVTDKGMFQGVAIHEDVFPPAILQRMQEMGHTLATAYAKAGYRGYFDVDCLSTKDGQLLLAESNVRRTGGTHAYHAAKYLIGKNFLKERYVLAINNCDVPNNKILSFEEIKTALDGEKLLFNTAFKEGIVLACASSLKARKLAYIIFGKTREQAENLEKKMLEKLALL